MDADALSLHWDADDNVEAYRRYTTGGYHPVCLGDVLAASADAKQYRVLHKLGHGSFSTVWLATDLHLAADPGYVALKVCVARADPAHELAVFSRLASPPAGHQRRVVELLDSFVLRGPNGTHTALVHPVLGSLAVMSQLGVKELTPQRRSLCRQMAEGVAFLHRRGVAHGDLHLGNIGVALPTLQNHAEDDLLGYGRPEVTAVLTRNRCARPEGLPPYLVPPFAVLEYLSLRDPEFNEGPWNVEIMDLGNAVIEGEPPRPSCTPAAVCAPEIMFARVARSSNAPATRASDIWSLACTMYELVFGAHLFYFASANDALLENMVKLCGEIPPSWTAYFNSRRELANLVVSTSSADDEWRTHARSVHDPADVQQFFALIRSMLKIDPDARPTAEDVLRHAWFSESI